MNHRFFASTPLWSVTVPVVACLILVLSIAGSPGGVLLSCATFGLIASVLVAVHHAEVIAHRVGEPFGTLRFAVFLFLAMVP
jgi:Ca2+:H+ antiporter